MNQRGRMRNVQPLEGVVAVSRELLREARELAIRLGDYVGNVDVQTGIDRCRVVRELLDACGGVVELSPEPEPGAETRPMQWHPRFDATNGCPLCGERIAPGAAKHVHVGRGGASMIRVDLPTVEGREGVMLSTGYDTGDMGWFLVDDRCAAELGPEWAKELPPL